MKKLIITAFSLIIAATAMVGCGRVSEDSTKDLPVTPVSEIKTESVDIQASTNSDGEVILDDKDENVTIETTADGEQIATIKTDDGSEVKVAVTTDDKGNKVIDTTKVVTDDGTVKKADNDSKTKVTVDDNGNVTVSTTTVDDTNSNKPVVTTTYDPTLRVPDTYIITTTYDPTIYVPDTYIITSTTPKTTTSTSKTTTSTPKTTTVTTTTSPKTTTTSTPKTTTTTTTTSPKTTTTKTTTTAPTTTTKTTTTTTAHVHNWVDVTETRTIHHNAEYATRTYWDKPCFYHGCKNLPESVFNTPGRYGDWMNLGWNDANDYMVPTFDLLLWKYGTPSNFPSYVQRFHSTEECDNFFGYSGSVLFCSTNPISGSHVPNFNPNTDIILTYDNYDLDCDAWTDLHGNAAAWDFWMYNSSADEVYPVFQEQIKVRDAWDETTTVVVGHKCTSCGATK